MLKILLAGSPASIMGFDRLIRLPNIGLASMAAQLDRSVCQVKIADLIAAGSKRKSLLYFQNILKKYNPDIIGFSCMVFQYADALQLARLSKKYNPRIKVVMGGYFPTVNYENIMESDDSQHIDYIIRKEGETAFNILAETLHSRGDLSTVPNLSFKDGGNVIHTPANPPVNLDSLKMPDRNARLLKKGFFLGPVPGDAVETSRGCVYDCNFCSIREMYGKSFRKYKIDRVIADIKDAREHGAKGILILDDNITLDGKRFIEICKAVKDAGLNDMDFAIQAGIRGIKKTPGLVKAMAEAGMKWIFLGIENVSDQNLQAMDKDSQFSREDVREVVSELQAHGIIVLGGLILGYPEDDEETLWSNFEYALELKLDIPLFFTLTPYPKTKIRTELLNQGLVTNPDDFSRYDGFQANIRTNHLTAERLYQLREEMGWKYPLKSASLFRLISKLPNTYLTKLFIKEIFKHPGDVFSYFKGAV